tara:strand:- start:288 stop:1364 length:1077 start_codon:yes stop_codon:yes gene_type:complete
MTYILCGLFLLGCKKKDDPAAFPVETFDAEQAARSELAVFEKVGCWEQTVEGLDSDGKTNRTEALMFVDWGLKGHHLLAETQIQSSGNFNFLRLRLRSGSTEAEIRPAEYSKHNLVIKFFNELAKTNPYQSVWVQDGLIYGFSGTWDNGSKQLNWHLTYPLGSPDVQLNILEKYPEKNRKIFSFEVLDKGRAISKGKIEAKHRSGAQKEKGVSSSPSPEIARLGREGVWRESQTIPHDDGSIVIKGQSRMRWTRDGRALINEGVLYTEGRPEYYLWVKTWDAVGKLYRYAYFFEDGPVHHYVGEWNPVSESIKWQSTHPEGAIVITESLKQPDKRTWTVMVKEGKWVTQGSGESWFYK